MVEAVETAGVQKQRMASAKVPTYHWTALEAPAPIDSKTGEKALWPPSCKMSCDRATSFRNGFETRCVLISELSTNLVSFRDRWRECELENALNPSRLASY